MATRTESIRVLGRSSLSFKGIRHALASAIRGWYRKGQLGTSYTTDMGRYTGSSF
jgi:hypothetical protein